MAIKQKDSVFSRIDGKPKGSRGKAAARARTAALAVHHLTGPFTAGHKFLQRTLTLRSPSIQFFHIKV
jgi:hypothetical protein